jgi:ABC-type multidrug transport system fused ATPase/permease subunit
MNFRLYKVFKSLDKSLKKNIFIILFLCLIIIPLEFLSLAAIIPLFAAIFDTTSSLKLGFLNFQIFEQNKINSSLIILVTIFFVKNFFLATLFRLKFKYVYSINKKLTHMIFFNNISSDYNFYIKNDTSTAIRNIMTEVGLFTSGYILSLIDLTIESLVLLTIGIFLIIYDPQMTISLFIFLFFITYLVDKVKKKRVEETARLRHKFNKSVLQLISGAFRGIKEIKANFLENKMFDVFCEKTNKAIKYDEKITYYRSLPKLIFEFFAVFALSIIVFVNNDTNSNIGEMIAIYTFAIFKILPSFVRLTLILQDLKLALPSINVIENEYLNKKEEIKKKIEKNILMLETINNNKVKKFDEIKILINEFKYDKNIILKNINFSIHQNDKICIFGKSGCGKSTLVDLLTGIIDSENLQVYLDEKRITDKVFFQKKMFSYIPQKPSIFQNTIKENITLFVDKIDEKRYYKALKLSKLGFINNLANGDNTLLSENGDNLSGGQLQRIFLARAIYSDKNILIFDESTNELDSNTEMEIVNDILNLPKTIFFITHKEILKEKFSKIFNIKNKEIN